jgi:glycosyltransferase involved in cell wall biosynthesis
MKEPLVSVVMGVQNGGDRLNSTISSILNQDEVDLEFIIIDDGSTDSTSSILAEAARKDRRLKILSRPNRGLTISLIEGCNVARGKFIARQDANDLSLPGRLKHQVHELLKNETASLCSTHVRFTTEEGVTTLISSPEVNEVTQGLKGIIHGSIMMRKDLYYKAGGYRRFFYFAQDVDLWSRMVELGDHIVIPHIYYEGLMFPGSISGTRKKEQERFFYYIQQATQARSIGKDEGYWLKMAENYSMQCQSMTKKKRRDAGGAYFIGSCLSQNNPTLAKKYFGLALQSDPTHLKARFKLASLK